ncbi:MAG: MFS transporter [Candidatus Thorarchaeota archaeon]
MEDKQYHFKNIYILIFSLLYLIQGITQSMFMVIIPIYLLEILGSVEASTIPFLGSIIMIPFIIKIIFGALSDKYGIKKLGRRKPWILGALILSGLVVMFLPSLVSANPSAVIAIIILIGFFSMFGLAMSDTVIDGFILDITPKNQLGRIQGATWGFRSLGIVLGGPAILLFMYIMPIDLIFIMLGIVTIIFAIFILYIKDIEEPSKVNYFSSLKLIIRKGENWKLFSFSFFVAIIDGVIFSVLSLYILIRAGVIVAEGATLEILETDINLYEPQAFISAIAGGGILIGAFLGGYIADLKSRRFAYLLSLVLITGSLLLLLIPVSVVILLIFIIIVGSASGWSHSSFGSIASGYAREYHEARSSYFALSASFVNFGTMLGLTLTGIIFELMSEITSDIYFIYSVVFIFMAILSNVGIIPFLTLDREIYELKLRNNSKTKS